jgi:hypothetical protein
VVDLLESGKFEHPEPIQDLVNGVQVVSLAYLNLSQYDDDDPEMNLEEVKSLFRDWIVAARGILDTGAEEDAPMGEPMPQQGVDPATGLPMPGGMPPGAMGPSLPGPGMGPGPLGPSAIPVPESSGLRGTDPLITHQHH